MEHIQQLIDLIKSETLADDISEVMQIGDNEINIVLKPGADYADVDSAVGDFQLEYVHLEPQLIINYVDENGNKFNE